MEMTALAVHGAAETCEGGGRILGLDGQYRYVGGAAQFLVVLDYIAAKGSVFFLYLVRHIGYIYLLGVENAAFIAPESIAPPIAPAPRKPIFIMMSS